jgi:hypothetical protein
VIEKTKSFKTGDGQIFGTVEEAQIHELTGFLVDAKVCTDSGSGQKLAIALQAAKEPIVDLLTMKATSHPKARKINGATRARKPRAAASGPTDDQTGKN